MAEAVKGLVRGVLAPGPAIVLLFSPLVRNFDGTGFDQGPGPRQAGHWGASDPAGSMCTTIAGPHMAPSNPKAAAALWPCGRTNLEHPE